MGSATKKAPLKSMVQAELLPDPYNITPTPHPNDDAPCPFTAEGDTSRCAGCTSDCSTQEEVVQESIVHEDDCASNSGEVCNCIAGLTGESATAEVGVSSTDAQGLATGSASVVAPSINLEEILAAQITEEYDQYPKEGRLFATDLGVALGPEFSSCSRAFWGKCRDEERRPTSPGTLLMFKMGELVEQYIIDLLQKALPKHGWKYLGTQRRYAQYGVSGKLDILIQHEETKALRVIDVKSKRGGAFGFLNEPKPDNVLQVQFYLDAIETLDRAMQAIPELAESNPPLTAIAGDVLYVDREGSNFVRQFEIDNEPERPREAARRLKVLRDGPEPEPLTPTLKRVENKGDDSIYLNAPWQVEWCDLRVCPCKKSIGKLPKGIAAKLTKKGVLKMTEGNEKFADVVLAMLREQYPNEDIRMEGK